MASIMLPNQLGVSQETPGAVVPSHVHLQFLDGLRGIMALYVVFHHVAMELRYAFQGGGIPNAVFSALKWLDFGHYAVDVFIVLSGYCLMIPVAKSGGILRGGFLNYIKRRSRRILPPYYAALILSVALIGLRGVFERYSGFQPAYSGYRLSLGSFFSHLFLLHNLNRAWVTEINAPMWSIAIEWQIYFLFPILLILWRRFGFAALSVAVFGVGFAPHYLFHGFLDWTYPWYIGLFVMGMAGSTVNFSSISRLRSWQTRVPWGRGAAILGLGFLTFGSLHGGWYADHRWIADPVVGLATVCLLVYCSRAVQSRNEADYPFVLRLFDTRYAVALGAFSYSLYSIHYPLIDLVDHLLYVAHTPPLWRVATMFAVVIPGIVACAYLFSKVFERRWQTPVDRKTLLFKFSD